MAFRTGGWSPIQATKGAAKNIVPLIGGSTRYLRGVVGIVSGTKHGGSPVHASREAAILSDVCIAQKSGRQNP